MNKNLVDKCVAFGVAIITAEDSEVRLETLYTIEDDAYYYIYCPRIGVFAYGNDIKAAEDNLVSAISVNFEALHRENRISELYANPLEADYFQAIDSLRMEHDTEVLRRIVERHLNPENTEVFRSPKKGAQIYNLTKEIRLKLLSEPVKEKAVS